MIFMYTYYIVVLFRIRVFAKTLHFSSSAVESAFQEKLSRRVLVRKRTLPNLFFNFFYLKL